MTEPPNLSQQLASLSLPRGDAPGSAAGGRLKSALILVAILTALAGVGFALRERLMRRSVETGSVILVQPGQEAPLFVATGTVVAPVTATLSPRTAGRLSKLLVVEGDTVAAGQPLALLDPTDPQLALAQAKADVASAEAKVAAARVSVKATQLRGERAARLFHGGAGTEGAAQDAALDLDAARAQLQVAEAEVGLARARLAVAARNLDDTVLRAPFRGVVLRLLAQPGDFVATLMNQGALQLADLSSMEVDAEVAEANLAKLVARMPVEVRLDAFPGRGIAGTVFSVRPSVDPAKATAIAKVRLELPTDGAPIAVFPGMNGRVSFLEHTLDAAALAKAPELEVPASALVRDGARARLLIVEKDGRLRGVTVATAGVDGDRVRLSEGPPAGTPIVLDPTGLHPGDRVQIKADDR